MFYIPSFICGTLIGGSIAYVLLRKFAANGMLAKIQSMLDSRSYIDKGSELSNALSIAAVGGVGFVVIKVVSDLFHMEAAFWNYAAYAALIIAIPTAIIYLVIKKIKKEKQ